MSTPDIWTDIDHDWHKPVVLPTLPVAARRDSPSVGGVTDAERRDRLAFAIRAAMGKRSAQDIAAAIRPTKSKETIARWARGETVPSALDVGPLATALGVKIDLLVNPPALPNYPLDDYLLEVADSAAEAAHRRASNGRAAGAPNTPARTPRRSARVADSGRG